MDEDCLNLNVYAPHVDPDRSRLFDGSFLKEICFFASPNNTREQGASYQWHFAIRFAINKMINNSITHSLLHPPTPLTRAHSCTFIHTHARTHAPPTHTHARTHARTQSRCMQLWLRQCYFIRDLSDNEAERYLILSMSEFIPDSTALWFERWRFQTSVY